jgi:hypothetical protein
VWMASQFNAARRAQSTRRRKDRFALRSDQHSMNSIDPRRRPISLLCALCGSRPLRERSHHKHQPTLSPPRPSRGWVATIQANPHRLASHHFFDRSDDDHAMAVPDVLYTNYPVNIYPNLCRCSWTHPTSPLPATTRRSRLEVTRRRCCLLPPLVGLGECHRTGSAAGQPIGPPDIFATRPLTRSHRRHPACADPRPPLRRHRHRTGSSPQGCRHPSAPFARRAAAGRGGTTPSGPRPPPRRLPSRHNEFSDITGRETGSAARMSTQFRFLLRELSDRKDHPVNLPKWEHPRWRR